MSESCWVFAYCLLVIYRIVDTDTHSHRRCKQMNVEATRYMFAVRRKPFWIQCNCTIHSFWKASSQRPHAWLSELRISCEGFCQQYVCYLSRVLTVGRIVVFTSWCPMACIFHEYILRMCSMYGMCCSMRCLHAQRWRCNCERWLKNNIDSYIWGLLILSNICVYSVNVRVILRIMKYYWLEKANSCVESDHYSKGIW